jgi:hypothetical protein
MIIINIIIIIINNIISLACYYNCIKEGIVPVVTTAIEMATDACAVSLRKEGDPMVGARYDERQRRHSGQLLEKPVPRGVAMISKVVVRFHITCRNTEGYTLKTP